MYVASTTNLRDVQFLIVTLAFLLTFPIVPGGHVDTHSSVSVS